MTSGHEGRTITSALLATRDTRSNEKDALSLELIGATDGIWVVRVSTIDDDVSLLKVGYQLLNEVIDSGSGLYEKDDFARAFEFGHKLLNGMSALNVCALTRKIK